MQAPEPMTAASIREPLLRGHHSVAALWFPASWFDENTRAARLIAAWRPGASALRFPQGDLLCYAAPVEANCDDLSGWSLRQQSGVLCSAPLRDAELAVIREGDVWIVLGAEVLVLHKRQAQPLDPSAWLAGGSLSLHDTYDLSVAPPAPEVLEFDARPLREVLNDVVPPASPEQSKFLDALRRLQRENPQAAPQVRHVQPGNPGGSKSVGLAVILSIAVIGIVVLLASSGSGSSVGWLALCILLIRLVFAFANSDDKIVVGSRTVAQPARPVSSIKARSKLAHPQRWRRWLARLAITTQLSRLIGRAQAKHMQRLLEMFDEGNLGEALRHAIPLGGDRGSLGQAFGVPGRRGSLDLSTHYGPSMTIHLGDDLESHLRALYRKAFEKFDREQRYDEAVFVLAELLNAKAEALDYLEKHQRFAQAAELALGWDMAPDVIVRLLCLSGDWRRALAVARRDDAFSTAIVQLEKRWPDVARRLREEWGNTLVERGDWVGAVDAVWPAESLRPEATKWLLTAEAAGGRLAMRALVQRAVVLPDTLERYAKDLQALQRDPLSWRDRQSLAEALATINRTPATLQLASMIAPALLADHAQGHRRFAQVALQEFVKHSGDVLLQVDMPSRDWPGHVPESLEKRAEVLQLDAPAAGLQGILDAARLDDDCFLVALGESGACVVDAAGHVKARFATPAHRLVMAHSRQVALLLAWRETRWRVSRLDLARKTAVDLGLVEFEFCANRFDGLHWTIAEGRRLRVLDTEESLSRVVWQVADLPGNVRGLADSATLEQVLIEGDEKVAFLWSYLLPQRRLRPIETIQRVEGQRWLLNPSYSLVRIQAEITEHNVLFRWESSSRHAECRLPLGFAHALQIWSDGEWLVIRTGGHDGFQLHWVYLPNGVECARVPWPGDSPPVARAFLGEWLIFDGHGRLMSFDVKSSHTQSISLR